MTKEEVVAVNQGNDEAQESKYLTFDMASETYGINVLNIVEILRMINITNVPESLKHIKGIVNIRGKTVPVMCIRTRFGREEIAYDDRTCIIVVSNSDIDVGLIVDTVNEVIEIPEKQINIVPKITKGINQEFVRGIGKIEDQIKIILDLEKLIEGKEFEDLSCPSQ